MSVLTVGPTGQFLTIHDAVAAAAPGDTVNVQAGVYTNDFFTIRHDLTIQSIGGFAKLVATVAPPDGKAYVTEGAAGISVTLRGLDVTGVAVADANGAAVRYEGGSLTLDDDHFWGNQEGLLGAADPNGSIVITNSEFDHNGDGSGSTHDLYIGAIDNFTLEDSYVHDAIQGHEIKSRAANNTITGDRVFDNGSPASYSIDLPNGGNATITGNTIEQGPNSPNQNIFAYGEEGLAHTSNAVTISGNTIVNDRSGGVGILNPTGVGVVTFSGNSVFGLANPLGGTVLTARPALNLSPIGFLSGSGAPPGPGTPPPQPPTPQPPPPPIPTPPPPPPALTIDQYHTLMIQDFTVYALSHPTVWSSSQAVSALMFEVTTTTVPTTHVAGDVWS